MPDRASTHGIPSTLRASMGGFDGDYWAVELADGTLALSSELYGTSDRITPSPEVWHAFRVALDAAGVWSWEPDYTDPSVLDGTQWRFEVQYPDRAMTSSGSNDYPGTFKQWLQAMRALTGHPELS